MVDRFVHSGRIMKSALVLLLVLLTTTVNAFAQNDRDVAEWQELFNGRNLDGWRVKLCGHELDDNFGETFRVEDGILKVVYDGYEDFGRRFGHIFYEESFSHYILRVEYRFVGEQVPGGPEWAFRNSGVMLHCQSPESMTKAQDFPISIEAQFLGGGGSEARSTANLCTPGTHVEMNGELVTQHCVESTSKTYHGDQWVTVTLVVLGRDRIEHWVEGEPVLSYDRPQIGGEVVTNHDPDAKKDGSLLREGYISLQSESHPIEFRRVALLNLAGCTDSKASNYKSYFVESDNSKCKYD